MKLASLVIDLLKTHCNSVNYDGLHIAYDTGNQRYWIYVNDIAYDNGRLAWFQVDSGDVKRLVIYDEKNVSSWIAVTSREDTDEHFDCHLIEWVGEYLTFIYHEKHKIYIGSVSGNRGRAFCFRGDMIKRIGDIIYCKEYLHNGIIKRGLMPSVTELTPVALHELEKEAIVLEIIGYGDNMFNLGSEQAQ
ncbi:MULTISPECIES: hypothetical protein [unclassified Pedobacter]|uniref:hypothetical protein n=1 Tax=unclassified Pedobacter TaxID=2628915 RepID=UPI00141F0DE6|nr:MULTISPECIES: hypothetical protein [unclassified Pedobacter]NII83388.1 hypothetical protein [Pedobacter sp. SG908]NMN37254.1 hypothetical protein [Pedobacter sp. SG918]